MEEGEDDGEISDDDDLEEGEVKDGSPSPKQPARAVCKFYNRGKCTYGNLCRFLHLSVNNKGYYNMFAGNSRYSLYGLPGNSPGNALCQSSLSAGIINPINQRGGPRGGPDFLPVPPPLPPPPPPTPVETAWERGLREAKELVKKANERKKEEPDFEEKRLNLSIDVNEKYLPDIDKENENYIEKSYNRSRSKNDIHYNKYDESNEVFDNGEREAREHWRGGRFENFEIRWTRARTQDMHMDRRDRERSRGRRISSEREKKTSKHSRSNERWRDERLFEIQTRSRGDEWVDPWRRSKTPKGSGRRSRSRSGSPYSSVSSYSYSDRSSRSSCSYSRSSSRSSCVSSRSPSVLQKRKLSPDIEGPNMSPKGPNSRFATIKKKPGTRTSRSRSYTRSHSSRSCSRSRSSSSRSHSISRTPSASRSRSYSRSLSMDSVSSASSSITRSSSGSRSESKRHTHISAFRKQEEKPSPLIEKSDSKGASASLYEEIQRIRQYDKSTVEVPHINASLPSLPEPPPLPVETPAPFPSFQHLLPPPDRVTKDPPLKGLHKQQIKLTLLNKPAVSKLTSLPKKELDVKGKPEELCKTAFGVHSGIKRPVSPSFGIGGKTGPTLIPKKSASSRRDELLKQLKAVEDAIARKRAKFC
ncbi:zinc finger CCCH domain-containing protein 18-like isoform X1 [Stegodyphus dumicola]|uniref:zinc finger CCCH domain-containing protein 18-like isoform X1 n=1 Tax=Stegodyphus dumicola TaxID=202533 RepID=UPI0015AC66FD|nr:zinc finger CCCH domain-containing protein 18-like isoform X1 [Stegodyphus dumicola]